MTVQYLIDSENVGDFWIPLLDLPAEETELIVFYTRNSPHMSYDSLIRLKESNRTVTFIKCYEGTNALDFQLVSELGYRICQNEEGRFVIVTNDTGFDAAVKYWRRRKKSVKRITGKEAKNLERRIREDLKETHRQGNERAEEAPVPSRRYTAVDHDSDHDAHVDACHAEAALDSDGRPSRTNLRDTEAALQPEISDLEPDEGEETFLTDEDLEMDPYEPEDEALNEGSYDEAAAENVSAEDGMSDDGSWDEAGEDDLFSYDETGVTAEDTSVLYDEADGPEGSDDADLADEKIVRAYARIWSGDPAEDETVPDLADSADEAPADTEEQPAYEQAAEETDAEKGEQILPDPVPGTEAEPAGEDAAETETEGMIQDPAGESPAAYNADAEALRADQDEADQDPESDPDASQEPQHRSRTRRSRSRRSRSSSKKQEQAAENETDPGTPAQTEPEGPETAAAEAAPRTPAFDADMPPGDEEIARIVACIGAENLAELHNQLATFYGDQGKEIYLSIKNNNRSLPVLNPDQNQKFAYYCEIIFARSDYSGEYPSDISEFLLSVREKLNNLNSLRYALQKHYGKEKGRRFYFLLKPFAKTMYQM